MKTKQLPYWLSILGLAVIVLAHTQLTMRQIALRVAGVREGEISRLIALDDYLNKDDRFDQRRLNMPADIDPNEVAILFDAHATFIAGELEGKSLAFDWGTLEVLDNTARHVLVSCESVFEVEAFLQDSNNYHTGRKNPGLVSMLALSVPRINVTPADLALGVFALCLAVFWWWSKGGIRPKPAFWAILTFLIIVGLSLIQALRPFDTSLYSPDSKRGIMELLQLVELFVIGWVGFSVLLATAPRRRAFYRLVCVMAGMVCVIGLIEYWAVFSGRTLRGLLDAEALDGPFGIRFNAPRTWSVGSESNRNVLALYLAMVLPFLVAGARHGSSRVKQVAAALFAALSLVLIMHLGLLILAFGGGLWVVLSGKARWMAAYAVLFALTIGSICLINPDHGKVLLDSVAIHRNSDPYGLQPMPSKGGSFEADMAWQQKAIERQAAFNAIGYSPVLGIGLGNYQAAINDFYSNAKVPGHGLEKAPLNLMERNSHAAFQVIAVETGALGLVAFILMLAMCVKRSMRAESGSENSQVDPVQAGVTGAAIVISLSIFQASFLIRGLGIIAIAILAATGRAAEESHSEPPQDDDSKEPDAPSETSTKA